VYLLLPRTGSIARLPASPSVGSHPFYAKAKYYHYQLSAMTILKCSNVGIVGLTEAVPDLQHALAA